jgi:hypothetical protein
MQQDYSQYRGYSIKTQRRDLCWTFTLQSTRPELPSFQDQRFWTATQCERLAIAQARQRVDRALEISLATPLKEPDRWGSQP